MSRVKFLNSGASAGNSGQVCAPFLAASSILSPSSIFASSYTGPGQGAGPWPSTMLLESYRNWSLSFLNTSLFFVNISFSFLNTSLFFLNISLSFLNTSLFFLHTSLFFPNTSFMFLNTSFSYTVQVVLTKYRSSFLDTGLSFLNTSFSFLYMIFGPRNCQNWSNVVGY